jgi:serine/threonine-protein kinase
MAETGVRAVQLPPKIGRHTVVGYLADGGMAEIFLGKEPDGRPVVIKRILPHLARQSNFVAMFIDEARIGSLVRHPNVVEIYELGQVGNDLFLVMEYLAGESTSGLLRRLVARRERLPLPLAAYIIAEACAGLYAAHTLCDDRGNPLDLVHRDVSPQNLFIKYDGGIKVLDFGIATAQHRLTRTATGQVKGKFSYMSPEQCRGEYLDLRSDIFSLGVVLYELTTQRRLFKRPNELMVLKAVTEQPIPRPRRELPDYPRALEAICMKALARDRDLRYGSALELRDELLGVIGQLGFYGDPRAELARVMAVLFPERIAEKRHMIGAIRAGSDLGALALPAAEVDESVELMQMEEQSATPMPSVPALPPPVARRSGWTITIAALVVLAAAGGATWYFARSDDIAPPVAVPAAPTGFAIDITSVPSGAAVYVDGEAVGSTPHHMTLTAPRELALKLELANYAPVEQHLTLDHAQSLLIPMIAAPTTPPPAPTVTPPPPESEPAKAPPKHEPKKPPRSKPDPFQRFD